MQSLAEQGGKVNPTMQPISKQLTTVRFNKTTTVNCSSKEVDSLVGNLQDVISPEYKAWYCKAIYKLGVKRVAELAITARNGASPRKYFSWLLKRELNA